MGVYIGDRPKFNFPSFVDAVCEELFDRAKNKIYAKRTKVLSRVPARISETLFAQKLVEVNVAAGRVLLDARVYYRAFFDWIFSLGKIKKPGCPKTGFSLNC